MTREEAILFAERLKKNDTINLNDMEAFCDLAINALAVYPVYKWERDIAMQQLEEYGIGFGEKKRDLVEAERKEEGEE